VTTELTGGNKGGDSQDRAFGQGHDRLKKKRRIATPKAEGPSKKKAARKGTVPWTA